ncbi:hypothetical protein [Marinobacter sp.]|uniref:hypothetical protein n=1 Tax=Marinobacter sp. TaxID=50741 RepID=UPI0025879C61|nr:hypothetical protein [Marinobacter sp.]MCW9010445.1 hypothetical protein [Marinobacter sp.]
MASKKLATQMSTKRPQKESSKKRLWKHMDAETTLLESSAFRWTVRIFGYTAMLYAAIVVLNTGPSGHEPLSPEYLNELVASLKSPALIAGISLPLLGLIASHLRSIQTKVQIETQQQQNTFSNYLAHRGQFNEFMQEEEPLKNISTISKWTLYGLLFPKAEDGNFEISPTLVSLFQSLPKRIENLRHDLESAKYNNRSMQAQIEKKIKDMEWDLREFTHADFSCDLNKEMFLCIQDKRIEKQIACIGALYECANFHSAQLEDSLLWEIQEKYVYCKTTISPQSMRERLLIWISNAAFPKGLQPESEGEREQELKGKLLYENRCKGGNDREIVIIDEIAEVIKDNFDEEQLHTINRILPPVINIYLNNANTSALEHKRELDDQRQDGNTSES